MITKEQTKQLIEMVIALESIPSSKGTEINIDIIRNYVGKCTTDNEKELMKSLEKAATKKMEDVYGKVPDRNCVTITNNFSAEAAKQLSVHIETGDAQITSAKILQRGETVDVSGYHNILVKRVYQL